jgi:hypothetical protein
VSGDLNVEFRYDRDDPAWWWIDADAPSPEFPLGRLPDRARFTPSRSVKVATASSTRSAHAWVGTTLPISVSGTPANR